MTSSKCISIYTDGSCNVQQKVGGWAIVSVLFSVSGNKKGTTNNEMELYSILKAIEYGQMYGYEEIHIYSDSQYAIGSLTEWAYNWDKNGWKKKGGIKNKEIIKEIFYILKDNPHIHLHKVKAHNGDEMNERADELARIKCLELVR